MATPWRSLARAWPVLSVLYTLILVGNAEWPWLQGAILGGLTIGVALLLGAPVWHLTGRLPIPERVGARFILVHLVAAAAFSVLWRMDITLRSGARVVVSRSRAAALRDVLLASSAKR